MYKQYNRTNILDLPSNILIKLSTYLYLKRNFKKLTLFGQNNLILFFKKKTLGYPYDEVHTNHPFSQPFLVLTHTLINITK